jgi:hypothetical protein
MAFAPNTRLMLIPEQLFRVEKETEKEDESTLLAWNW